MGRDNLCTVSCYDIQTTSNSDLPCNISCSFLPAPNKLTVIVAAQSLFETQVKTLFDFCRRERKHDGSSEDGVLEHRRMKT
jgi:hypothetical protein